jgi:hypothetical protein
MVIAILLFMTANSKDSESIISYGMIARTLAESDAYRTTSEFVEHGGTLN